MRSFLIFLAVIGVIGLIGLAVPILGRQVRDHEAKLVAALQLVEESIAGASTDILRVDLFAPEISQLAGADNWLLTGIVSTQDRAGKPVNARYVAAVEFTCRPYADPACGRIATLAIDGRDLIVGSAVVAALQEVLGSPANGLAGTVPSDGGAAPSDSLAQPSSPQITLLPGAEPALDSSVREPADAPVPPASEAAPAAPAPTPESQAAAPAPPPAPSALSAKEAQTLAFIQRKLQELGYDPGPADGKIGPRTTSAIETYQRRAGLTVDGQPSAELLDHISHATPTAAQ